MLDQGGHATRAIVFDNASNIICHADAEITTRQKGELIVEHDSEEMIASVFQALDGVNDLLGDDFSRVVNAGLATQRSSFVCWNKNTGRALTPVISWQDRRMMSDMARYDFAEALIHEKTGLYLNPHYGATKINWCLNNVHAVQSCLKDNELYIGPLASFILFHLLKSAPFKIDPANASRTLLMDYKKRSWDSSLMKVFDIPGSVLPEIEDTVAMYGQLNYKDYDIPLSVCTGDQSAAIYMAGIPCSKSVYVNIGTGAFIQQYSEKIPELGEERMLASIVYAKGGSCAYVIEGTVNGAARALDWLANQLGGIDYQAHLDEWGTRYSAPPIFLNGISGVGSPFWRPNFVSRFLTDAPNEAQFVGVMESIVFLIYTNIKAMRKISDIPERIVISGGLSNSDVICQKLADLSCMGVYRAQESEATALGVYFLLTHAGRQNDGLVPEVFYPSENLGLMSRYDSWLERMTSE